ncbi:LysM peptidoglycan-binding domain-containing protein [Winogradskyella undariae]|uniref:LysM peptidoglycan-binding domain-containing protein n=1 Tax=Winogradskyella undariae TaxID=1285465 RepID=UPI00156AA023|nr:LysM peptidoglycan-binding domain-containing protein [Winogradskyella undariae]NRR91752.1 LysM peptidoglycan-binding domain-containing protein [Winogradskyella undariae]
MKRLLTLILILAFNSYALFAQEDYKEHVVKEGENIYMISRQYRVTPNSIFKLNPGSEQVIYVGSILRIPNSSSTNNNSSNNKPTVTSGNNDTVKNYVVQKGDTKFSLSRRFGVSINELEQQNPHIRNMLQTGHIINLNNTKTEAEETTSTIKETVITETNTTTPSITTDTTTITEVKTKIKGYKDYVIKPKQTLYSLSMMTGMSTEDLITLNPKLKTAVVTGDIIKVPTNITQTNDVKNTLNNSDSTKNIETEKPPKIITNNNEALYANLVKNTANGIYFYTPFSSDELSSPEGRQKILEVSTDYKKYIDFFQGAQIAIDSAKALKLEFDVTLIKKNIAESKLTVDSPYNKNVILVPFLDGGSQFPEIKSDKSVSIIDIKSNLNSSDNINIYKSIPSDTIQKTKTLNYLAKQNANTIVVSDLDEAKNKTLIKKILPDSKFLKVNNSGFFNSEKLKSTLDKTKLNYIVLDSDKTIILLNTTTALMRELSEYDIQLVMIESELISKQNQVSEMRFKILKLIFPSNTNSLNKSDITDFENKYKSIFDTAPTENSILGFNVTLDALLRISQDSSFEETINNIISTQPHLKFEYKKIKDGYYFNRGIYLMQYNSEEGILEVD